MKARENEARIKQSEPCFFASSNYFVARDISLLFLSLLSATARTHWRLLRDESESFLFCGSLFHEVERQSIYLREIIRFSCLHARTRFDVSREKTIPANQLCIFRVVTSPRRCCCLHSSADFISRQCGCEIMIFRISFFLAPASVAFVAACSFTH